jgi:hypothetical protein
MNVVLTDRRMQLALFVCLTFFATVACGADTSSNTSDENMVLQSAPTSTLMLAPDPTECIQMLVLIAQNHVHDTNKEYFHPDYDGILTYTKSPRGFAKWTSGSEGSVSGMLEETCSDFMP